MPISDEMIDVSCDICGCEGYELLFVKEGFRHVRCSGCAMVYVTPRLKHHARQQEECGTGTMGETRISSAQRRRLRREIASLEPFRKTNRIIDVGAGKGWFIAEAAAAGWEAWAVEINADAIEHLKSRGIARIIAEPAECFEAPADSVDVVRMWDVVEHLQSPRAALTNVYRLLRSGGLVRLATTNFGSLSRIINGPEWVYLNGADHIHLFEPRTVTRLLEQLGFRQVRTRTRSFNLRKKLYFPDRELPVTPALLRPFRKIIDEAIRLTPFGHQMIVTAIKPPNP